MKTRKLFGALLILVCLILVGCAPATKPDPTVDNVVISPSSVSVARGTTQQFSAVVNGTNSPSQGVTWTVTGGGAGTTINSGGLLTVASGEPANILTIKATSTQDTNHFGTAEANITGAIVTSVVISPKNVNVATGTTQQFSATISGSGNPPQSFSWSVSSNNASGTSISSSGLLTVASSETSTTLIVTVTSTYDNSKIDTATVTVTSMGGTWDVYDQSTWITAISTIRNGGNNKHYNINVLNDITIPVSNDDYTFGDGTSITVNITGNHTISGSGNGRLLYIKNLQRVIITDITLQGRNGNSHSVCEMGVGATCNMEGYAKITGNAISGSYTYGAGVYLGNYATFLMKDNASIMDNSVGYFGGGVFIGGESVNMTMQGNASIINNSANRGGGIFINGSNANLIMQGNTSVSGNSGNGVYISGSNNIFSMQGNALVQGNTIITDNFNYDRRTGGGVCVSSENTSFTMQDNALIQNNWTNGFYSGGGGVYVSGANTAFTMKGSATVSNNSSDGNGGGVWIYGSFSIPHTIFTIQDNATITSNTAPIGGGLYLGGINSGSNVGRTFIMKHNSQIINNTATSSSSSAYGGGIYVYAHNIQTTTITIENGNISGNSANSSSSTAYGGGIYLYASVYNFPLFFTMQNGAISSNSVFGENAYGGGIYANSDASFILQNANITDNTATAIVQALGGGVYGRFTMEGGVISGNTLISSTSNSENIRGGGCFGELTKTGGIIYGNEASATLRNLATGGNGHAAFRSTEQWRNLTAGASQNTADYGFWLND